MPLYDYHCKACDAAFELLVRSGTVPDRTSSSNAASQALQW